MKNLNLPYKIKPKLMYKGFFLFILVLLMSIVLINKYSKDIFITFKSFAWIIISVLIVLIWLNRTITIENNGFRFKSIIRNEFINYKDIVSLDIKVKETRTAVTFNLIVNTETRVVIIPYMQFYNKEGFEYIFDEIQRIKPDINYDYLMECLDKVKWV